MGRVMEQRCPYRRARPAFARARVRYDTTAFCDMIPSTQGTAMSEKQSKSAARELFEHLGYTVRSIAEKPNVVKTPDFLMVHKDDQLLVEVKARQDYMHRADRAAAQDAASKPGEVVSYSASFGDRDDFRKLAHKAQKQLNEYTESGQHPRLVFLYCGRHCDHDDIEWAVRAVLGKEILMVLNPDAMKPGAGFLKDPIVRDVVCAFFKASLAFDYQDIDGFIVCGHERNEVTGELDCAGVLILNPFAERRESLRRSHLYRVLLKNSGDGVCDIEAGLGCEGWLIANPEIPRNLRDNIIRNLEQRYGLMLRAWDMEELGATVVIPPKAATKAPREDSGQDPGGGQENDLEPDWTGQQDS